MTEKPCNGSDQGFHKMKDGTWIHIEPAEKGWYINQVLYLAVDTKEPTRSVGI